MQSRNLQLTISSVRFNSLLKSGVILRAFIILSYLIAFLISCVSLPTIFSLLWSFLISHSLLNSVCISFYPSLHFTPAHFHLSFLNSFSVSFFYFIISRLSLLSPLVVLFFLIIYFSLIYVHFVAFLIPSVSSP